MQRVSWAVLALVLVAPLALGEHPAQPRQDCPGLTTVYYPADAEKESSPVYVAIDYILSNGYPASVWMYAESNGIEALQRHDDYCSHGEAYRATHDDIIF